MRISHGVAGAAALLAALAGSAHAQFVNYTVSLNTAPLTTGGTYTGPFALDFQFFDGGGSGIEPNNTAFLSSFSGQAGTITPFSLTDGFPPMTGESIVSFTPGATLRFNVRLTTNVDTSSPGPDVLSLLLLSNGNTIATTDLTGGNAFVTITESDNPATPSAVTTATSDAASGPAFSPTIITAAPEASSLALFCAVGATALPLIRRRKA